LDRLILLSALCVACGGVILAGCIGGANISRKWICRWARTLDSFKSQTDEPTFSRVLTRRWSKTLYWAYWGGVGSNDYFRSLYRWCWSGVQFQLPHHCSPSAPSSYCFASHMRGVARRWRRESMLTVGVVCIADTACVRRNARIFHVLMSHRSFYSAGTCSVRCSLMQTPHRYHNLHNNIIPCGETYELPWINVNAVDGHWPEVSYISETVQDMT